MAQAVWNGVVVAESDDTVLAEGNHYFPESSFDREHFVESGTHSVCPWKGTASYLTLVVDGKRNEDAAWYYPQPKPGADAVRGRVAFWKGVRVITDGEPAGGRGGGLAGRLGRLLAS